MTALRAGLVAILALALSLTRLASARVSPTEKDKLNNLYTSGAYPHKRVDNLRAAASVAVGQPCIEHRAALESLAVQPFVCRVGRPR